MKRYVVFDSHCDTATELWHRGQTLMRNSCHVSLPRAEAFGGYGQFFAFCTMAGAEGGYTHSQLLWEPHKYFMKQLERFSDRICLCTRGDEFDPVVKSGRVAAYLSLEGAEGIGCDPGLLEPLRESGVTMVNLTWNRNNALAGCSAQDGPGLSRQGREFVRRAQSLGMIIDVSHVSDRAFRDLMDITERPVVASHSNSRSRCGHSRNLTDDQFLAICDCGGYAGINLCPDFLSDDGNCDLETIYVHMDHFLQLGGGHVAMGGDLDGISGLPKGIGGLHDYEALASFLEKKAFSPETIQDIYCNTMKKVVTKCTM